MKARIELDTSSLVRVDRELNRRVNNVRAEALNVVKESAEHLFATTQATVPVKTGALRDSGKVTEQNSVDEFTSIISYGGNNVNPTTGETTAQYAVEKHEDPKSDGYKWLEKAALQEAELFNNRAVTYINRALK